MQQQALLEGLHLGRYSRVSSTNTKKSHIFPLTSVGKIPELKDHNCSSACSSASLIYFWAREIVNFKHVKGDLMSELIYSEQLV